MFTYMLRQTLKLAVGIYLVTLFFVLLVYMFQMITGLQINPVFP